MKAVFRSLAAALLCVLALPSCMLHPCPSDCVAPQEATLEKHTFHGGGTDRDYTVYATRTQGPPMLILHELGGLNGCTLQFGELEGKRGWKVYLPALDSDYDMCSPIKHALRMRKKVWDSRNPNGTGPIYRDLEQMVQWISDLHGGQRVVVMGNCLTGNYPLGLLAHPKVKTAVLCQPAMPLKSAGQALFGIPESAENQKALALSTEQLHAATQAMDADPSKKLIGFHYLHDPLASFAKFEVIHERLSRKFHAVVMVPKGEKKSGAWYEAHETTAETGRLKPHSTVTASLDKKDREFLQRRFDELVRPGR
jgi:dienelactone hydrolase